MLEPPPDGAPPAVGSVPGVGVAVAARTAGVVVGVAVGAGVGVGVAAGSVQSLLAWLQTNRDSVAHTSSRKVSTGNYDVTFSVFGPGHQLRYELWGMLKVCVHHADPVPCGSTCSLCDRPREAIAAASKRPMNQGNW